MNNKKINYKHTIAACCFGYVTQAIVNNFAPLLFLIFKDEFGIPLEKITLIITINFLVQLLVDFLSAKLVDKIGYRKCIVAAHIFATLGIAGMAVFSALFVDAYAGILLSVVLYAIGGGIIEVLVSPIVEACPTKNKSAVMSLLHSFYCWGVVAVVLLSTLFLGVAGKGNWRILAYMWAILPLLNGIFFCFVPISRLTDEGESMPIQKLFTTKIFWLFVVLMISAGACELAMSQWASAFAESGLKVSKTAGDLAGPCMFAVLMGIARVFYAKFSERIKLINFIIGSGFLCVLAYVTVAVSSSPVISLFGCGLCGLSVGIMWPGVFSLAAEKMPKGGTAMFALFALAGDFGCSLGPTLVGMVSGAFNDDLKSGLTSAIIFPIVLIICGVIYKRQK